MAADESYDAHDPLTPHESQTSHSDPPIPSPDDPVLGKKRSTMRIVVTTGNDDKDKEIVQNALNEIEIEKKRIEKEMDIDLSAISNDDERTPPPLTANEPIPSETKDEEENAPNTLPTENERKQNNLALDHSKLIEALDGNKNESIYDDEDESELSTDDDEDEDDEDNLSIQSSDNEDVYDLADTDGLEQMMSIREDFGKNKLIPASISRKNVFAEIGRQQSREIMNEKSELDQIKEDEEIDEYEAKMEKQLIEMIPPKNTNDDPSQTRAAQILSLNEQADTPTFADLKGNNKSATIRAFESVSQSNKHIKIEDDEEDIAGERGDEYTLSRRIWYIFRVFVVIYLYISTPFQFAFTFNDTQLTPRIVLLFLFGIICDIFMWVNTVYEFLNYRHFIDDSNEKVIKSLNESKGEEDSGINSPKSSDNRCLNQCILKRFGATSKQYEAFKSYRSTHQIWFDFFVNFPFDFLVLITLQNYKYFVAIRMLKIFHCYRFFEYFESAFCDFIPDRGVMRSAFVSRLARIFVAGIAWIHLWSCFWFFLGSNLYVDGDYKSKADNQYDTWLTAYYDKLNQINNGQGIDYEFEYLWSIYFVTVTFSTVGYGDIVPMNSIELALLIIFQLINYVFVTIFVAELAPVIEEFFFRHLSRASQHRMLAHCFDSIHIGVNEEDKLREANRSLLSFIKHVIDKSKENINEQKDKESLQELLSSLTAEQLIPAGLLRKIANECISKSFIRDQIILSQNVENNSLYFLIDGKVKKQEEDETDFEEISNYPNFFGHESFWKSKTRSPCTYTAQTIVKVFVISSKQIKAVLKPRKQIQKCFSEILELAYPSKSKVGLTADFTLRRKPALQIAAEQKEISKIYRYSSLIWDIFNAFAIMLQSASWLWGICFFALPPDFNKTPYLGPLIWNWMVDAFFVVDIVFAMNPTLKIAYFYPARAGGEHRSKPSNSDLIKDILTVIPFELFLLFSSSSAWKTTYIYLLRSFKWLRLRYISRCWSSWVELLRATGIPTRFTRVVVLLIGIIHFFACIWYLIGTVSLENDDELNWISNDAAVQETDNSRSISRSYIRSYYFVMITETTIGYGGIVPFSTFEILYDVMLVFMGSIIYWLAISWFAMHASYKSLRRVDHTNLVSATEHLLQKQRPTFREEHRLVSNQDEKKKDERENDELMARLQNYFDFVLQEREGAVSFWEDHKASLQTFLKYEFLSTAIEPKKRNDPQRYSFLEYISEEIMLEFAQKLEWMVVCKSQTITLKQSGNDCSVLFLVTGTLWSPYSKYIFSRHSKDEDKVNKSDIITFNLECLSPINLKICRDEGNEVDVTQKLSTYLQIDCVTHSHLVGLYEICNAQSVGLQEENYSIIYQQIPPDQQQQDMLREQPKTESDGFAEETQIEDTDRTLTFLVYETKSEEELEIINESDNQRESQMQLQSHIDEKWKFLSIDRKNGALDFNTQRVLATYSFDGDEKSIDAKDLSSNHWNTDNEKCVISITDELHFEALECCDVVRLSQRDALDAFETSFELRLKKYLQKTEKNAPSFLRHGSLISPKSSNSRQSTSRRSDQLSKLLMNDVKLLSAKVNNAKIKRASSKNLLPQFKKKTLRSHRNLFDKESLVNTTKPSMTQSVNEIIKKYQSGQTNAEWVQQVESITINKNKYRFLKIIWYLTGICFIGILQFLLPQRAIFLSDETFKFFGFDIAAQLYFSIDFIVGVRNRLKTQKLKANAYNIKAYKLLDLVLVIPWPFIGLAWSWELYYFFRLAELLRITRIKYYWNDLRDELVHFTGKIISIHTGLSAIIFHIFVLFLTASYCACLWFIIGETQRSYKGEAATETSWIFQESKPVFYGQEEEGSDRELYSLSIYWAICSMSSVGYGDLKPITWTETLFAIIVLPFMVLFYIQFMGDLTSFAQNIESATKQQFYQKFSHTLLAINRRIEHLEVWNQTGEVSTVTDLKYKIRKYLLSLWKERAGMSEDEIYDNLPYFLSRDISYQCRKKYLHSIPCLTQLIESTNLSHIELAKSIAFRLQHHVITRHDEMNLNRIYVVEKGDMNRVQIELDIGDNLIKFTDDLDEMTHAELLISKSTTEQKEEEENEENEQQQQEKIDRIEEEEEAAGKSLFSSLSIRSSKKADGAKLCVYLPPKASNKQQHKIRCISTSASIYSLDYEDLSEIQRVYDENKDDAMKSVMDDILKNYWYDREQIDCSIVHVAQNDTANAGDASNSNHAPSFYDHSSKHSKSSRHALKLNEDDGSKHNKHSYQLLYNPKRTIFRLSHPLRLRWEIFINFGLFAYAILLPLQYSNFFYTFTSMKNAMILSIIIDVVFIIDFVFRLLYFAPHPTKRLDPFYVMIGKTINNKLKQKYAQKLPNESDKFRDIPTESYEVRPNYQLILELIAMIPFNLLSLVPSLYSIHNQNIYFRLNKALYYLLFFRRANRSISEYVSQKQIYFLSARIFRISVLFLCVLHWMACIWLQFADFDDENESDKTWLTEMDTKRKNIATWSEDSGYAYLLSLYFVAVTMTTTGYGDITPVTYSEISMTNLLIILGDTLMALIAGVFIQYISNINQPSLDIAIKERSITHYLDHRSKEIIKRTQEIVEQQKQSKNDDQTDPFYGVIDEKVLKKQKKSFDSLIKRLKRYFLMQLDYQHKVSTIDSLTQHLPLYYRLKLLHALFKRFFKKYDYLYKNERLYLSLLDNVQEQLYTYWDDGSFEFIFDPQQSMNRDLMIIQFGEVEIFSKKGYKEYMSGKDVVPQRKSSGDLIGFRSLVLHKKLKSVIRPVPPRKAEKFRMVSILKVPETKWNEIIDGMGLKWNEEREEFVQNESHDE